MKDKQLGLFLTLLALFASNTIGAPLGTAFTYQGQLQQSGAPANGAYDFRFEVYDNPSGGGPLGGTVRLDAVPVTNGLFTVELDFGPGVFTGNARWLEIGVRTNASGSYTTLSPRQPCRPTPYALFAPDAEEAQTALGVAEGVVGNINLISDAVTSDKIADGTLTEADLDPSLSLSTFWRLGGNAGTSPGTHFLGTIDDQPLELRANNRRGLRLQYMGGTFESMNLTGGWTENSIAGGTVGATIAGGGRNGLPNTIGTAAHYSTIGGGRGQSIADGSWFATVAGGRDNSIGVNSGASTVGGGFANSATNEYAVVAGGLNNIAGEVEATVGGGSDNRATGAGSTIAGGSGSLASGNESTIGGGNGNTTSGFRSTIGGGAANVANLEGATVGGGEQNRAAGLFASVAGGYGNEASGAGAVVGGGGWGSDGAGPNQASAPASTVGGGSSNLISATAYSATIAGGYLNRIEGVGASVIGGGSRNLVEGSGNILGGSGNRVVGTGSIVGGTVNTIEVLHGGGFIGGGDHNTLASNASDASIVGGQGNTNDASWSSIGGGLYNRIGEDGLLAVIPGGFLNVADQLYAFAAGHQAKALHKAAFVWADSTDADFASTGNDQFLIRASGGVGIGTTSPQQALHVAGDTLVRGTNFTATGHTARLLLGDGNHTLRSEYGGGLRFGVWPDPNALVIQDGSGNVGIGTPAPAGKLHVNGTAGNNTGTWSSFSDRRLKQDIRLMSHGALDQLLRLEGVTFDYTRPELREGYEGVRRGWIAQQVEQVFPEWVSEAPDGMKMVTPVGFNALTVEALRELRAEKDAAIQGLNQKLNQKLEHKETEITELKARLEKLEQLLHSLILKPTH